MKTSPYCSIPDDVLERLSHGDRHALKQALENHFHAKHSVDLRYTLPIPFYPKRLYVVLLAGVDRRQISRAEYALKLSTVLLLLGTFVLFSVALGISCLYVIKALLGIDIFAGFSLGLWS